MLVRTEGKVRRARFARREEALAALEAEGRALERTRRREEVDLRYRTYAPDELVAGRVELRGPRGVHAGVDVRGDGTLEVWRGLVRKRVVVAEDGESPYAALGRAV